MRPTVKFRLFAFSCFVLGTLSGRAGELRRVYLDDLSPKAGAIVVIDDLRDRSREFLESDFAKAVKASAIWKVWTASEGFSKLEEARRNVETILDSPLARIRDDLLGDCAILSLELESRPSGVSASYLFLTKVRDPAFLNRIIRIVDASQVAGGEIKEVVEGRRGSVSYRIRRHVDPSKPAEAYALLDDGTFVWSDSEAEFSRFIDAHQMPATETRAGPAWLTVDESLPGRPVLRILLNPTAWGKLVPAASPEQGAERAEIQNLRAVLASIESAGLGLEWNRGLFVSSVMRLAPDSYESIRRTWANSRPRQDAPPRTPPTAFALVSADLGLEGIHDWVTERLPDSERARFENARQAIEGLLLGKDLRAEILAKLGPTVYSYLETPRQSPDKFGLPPTLVLPFRLEGSPVVQSVGPAIENAFRTILALYSLDPKNQGLRLRTYSRTVGDFRITELQGGPGPFAFGVGPDRIVVAAGSDAVERFARTATVGDLASWKAKYYPEARVSAAIDLAPIKRWIASDRRGLSENLAEGRMISVEQAESDLARVSGLLGLLRGAYLALSLDDPARCLRIGLGLLPSESTSP